MHFDPHDHFAPKLLCKEKIRVWGGIPNQFFPVISALIFEKKQKLPKANDSQTIKFKMVKAKEKLEVNEITACIPIAIPIF